MAASVPGPQSPTTDTPPLFRLLLVLLLGLTTLRLIGFMARFALESLQMDFAAFYTAGEALNAGLSPYRAHLATNPPIWDGINEFVTSRFLYPPLVATLFQPVARLDYFTAKILWMVAGLGALLLSIALTNRYFHLERQPLLTLLFGLLLTTYYPLLTYLERGQIDAFTLLLLILAIWGLLTPRRGHQVGAGLLITLATLLKLQCIYVVPFLFWRRHWWAVLGYAIGGALLLLLSLNFNGSTALRSYLQDELPRISQYGDLGAPETLMDRATWQALHAGAPDGYTTKDGRFYLPESFFFTKNATMVRNLHSVWNKVLGAVSQSTVSLVAFGALLIGVILWEKRKGWPIAQWTEEQHFFYWQVVLLVILLTGPMTWIMNLIWLLPLALALLATTQHYRPQDYRTQRQGRFVALALAGIIITALPDIYAFPLLVPFGATLLRWHYVCAEVLIFVALLLYLNAAIIHHQEKLWPNVT